MKATTNRNFPFGLDMRFGSFKAPAFFGCVCLWSCFAFGFVSLVLPGSVCASCQDEFDEFEEFEEFEDENPGGEAPDEQPMNEQPGADQQGTDRPAPSPFQRPSTTTTDEEQEWQPPEVEVVTLETNEAGNLPGVLIQCDYYAGKPSKMTVPVLLLHDFDSSRQAVISMAVYLQSLGHSVIAPDLRGHGASTKVVDVDDPIDRSNFNAAAFLTIVNDIERCKKFMMSKNNVGEVNIELLTVVTVGKSAIPASHWSVSDWSWQPVNGRKQGQDVKAVAMIGAERRFKSASMTQALRTGIFTGEDIERPIAVMLSWAGDNEEQADEGSSLETALTRSRRRLDQSHLSVMRPYETGVSAIDLAGNPDHQVVFQDVGNFIEAEVVSLSDALRWQARGRAASGGEQDDDDGQDELNRGGLNAGRNQDK